MYICVHDLGREGNSADDMSERRRPKQGLSSRILIAILTLCSVTLISRQSLFSCPNHPLINTIGPGHRADVGGDSPLGGGRLPHHRHPTVGGQVVHRPRRHRLNRPIRAQPRVQNRRQLQEPGMLCVRDERKHVDYHCIGNDAMR